MACLLKTRGKYYRKSKLDIWGQYGGNYEIDSVAYDIRKAWFFTVKDERGRNIGFREKSSKPSKNARKNKKKVDNTLRYWDRFLWLKKNYGQFNQQRYMYKVWNRRYYQHQKKIRYDFIKPRFLRNYYMILKKKTYVSYVEKALKGKLGRGFLVNYLGYLEGRLMVIAYRLNLINNVFIIKNAINAGFFHINQKKKKHINTRMNLGDILQIGKKWKKTMKKDIYLRAKNKVMRDRITYFFTNYDELYFILYRRYLVKDIIYPIKIDLYRAIDFIGPLR